MSASPAAVSIDNLTKRYGDVQALAGVSFDVAEYTVCGLLGRNGAGKTTVMQILTGQGWATSGQVRVFCEQPFENERILADVCFVKESQRYPDLSVRAILAAAARLYPQWNTMLADELLADFALPLRRGVKKLSRGQLSAVGIVIGLASRSRLTLFDEPYLGLDAVARQLFYDRLLADYAEYPRTILLSTHLIDEVSELLEHVVLIDHGQVLLAGSAEALRERAVTVTGPTATVERFAAPYDVLHRESLGGVTRSTVSGRFTPADRSAAIAVGLDLQTVSLQQLVVRTTTRPREESS
ncbi:MAG: ABC transporter ATP-binding protein [Geodermatophilaceae bacterium]|nr:ABC transporter ATP-binding protein [Geodermatophilaceae bacterium]